MLARHWAKEHKKMVSASRARRKLQEICFAYLMRNGANLGAQRFTCGFNCRLLYRILMKRKALLYHMHMAAFRIQGLWRG